MFKKLALTFATLATLVTASVAMSNAARAGGPWDWRHRQHQFGGNGGNNWGPPQGTFHPRRFSGFGLGDPFFWGGPSFYFGGPSYGYDEPYYASRHCRIKRVKRYNHWATRRVCRYY